MADSVELLEALPDPQERRDPVEIIAAQDEKRLQDLVPIRHQRMSAGPFPFYRGAAAVMAADLASTPHSGVITQLCGDAHLSNFGLFFSPERRLLFDLNDFDETHPGPFEWDVKRLAASLTVAALDNGDSAKDAKRAARRVAWAYRKQMEKSAAKSALACWYDHADADVAYEQLAPDLDTASTKRMKRLLKKSKNHNNAHALDKLCVVDGAGAHIKSDPPLLVPMQQLYPSTDPADLHRMFEGLLSDYRATLLPHVADLFDQYRFVEAARKAVGVGSVGTRCWFALLAGNAVKDPLFIQVKEASDSVLAPYVDRVDYPNQGMRVVLGQRQMQAASDIFLGWFDSPDLVTDSSGARTTGKLNVDFYLRQLRDGKGSVVVDELPIDRLIAYGELCGAVLATAHARTAARTQIAALMADLGKTFDQAIARWAAGYADLNRSDHSRMVDAVAAGDLA